MLVVGVGTHPVGRLIGQLTQRSVTLQARHELAHRLQPSMGHKPQQHHATITSIVEEFAAMETQEHPFQTNHSKHCDSIMFGYISNGPTHCEACLALIQIVSLHPRFSQELSVFPTSSGSRVATKGVASEPRWPPTRHSCSHLSHDRP